MSLKQQIREAERVESSYMAENDLLKPSRPWLDPSDLHEKVPEFQQEFGSVPYIPKTLDMITESQFGTLSWQGLRIVPLAHRVKANNASDFRLLLEGANTHEESIKDSDKTRVKDHINAAYREAYEYLVDVWRELTVSLGYEPPEENVGKPNRLREMAKFMARDAFVYRPYRAMLVERKVALTLAYDFGLRVAILPDEKADAYGPVPEGYDSYESAGIDLYAYDPSHPERGMAIQVKEGDGGKTEDESDVLARYIHQREGTPISNPFVRFESN